MNIMKRLLLALLEEINYQKLLLKNKQITKTLWTKKLLSDWQLQHQSLYWQPLFLASQLLLKQTMGISQALQASQCILFVYHIILNMGIILIHNVNSSILETLSHLQQVLSRQFNVGHLKTIKRELGLRLLKKWSNSGQMLLKLSGQITQNQAKKQSQLENLVLHQGC